MRAGTIQSRLQSNELADAFTRNRVRERQVGLYVGAGAFTLLVGHELNTATPTVSADFFTLFVRGLAVAALGTGFGWCASPSIVAVYDTTFAPTIRRRRERELKRAEEKQKAAEAKRTQREEQRRKAEWQRGAPERQRQEQLRVQQRRTEEQAQKRREDARALCLLYFNRFETDLCDRFSRTLFDEFLQKHLSDRQSPDDVEDKGQQLRQMIDDVLAVILPGKYKKPRTIEEFAHWYLAQREHIAALSLDDDLRQTHLVSLDSRYMELTQSALERAQP